MVAAATFQNRSPLLSHQLLTNHLKITRLYLVDINSSPYLNTGPNSTTDASASILCHRSSNYPAHHGWVRDDTVDHGVTSDLDGETRERALDRVSPIHQMCLCFSWFVDDIGFIIRCSVPLLQQVCRRQRVPHSLQFDFIWLILVLQSQSAKHWMTSLELLGSELAAPGEAEGKLDCAELGSRLG
jgi:hypothetical protein